MIEILSGFPDDVLAVEASGEISAEDYRKVLIPAALEKMKGHEAVRLFCHILPGATVEAGAVWEDAKIELGHWRAWGRLAVVSDIGWVRSAVAMFAPFYHHPARAFANDDLAKARDWIVEKEKPAS